MRLFVSVRSQSRINSRSISTRSRWRVGRIALSYGLNKNRSIWLNFVRCRTNNDRHDELMFFFEGLSL